MAFIPSSLLKLSPVVPASHRAIETLEPRIAPAFVGVGTAFTYVDDDGDSVEVRVTGTAGSAEFTSVGGTDLSTGAGTIATVEIQNPSANFAITFAHLNANETGDGRVSLGRISGVIPAGGAEPARAGTIRGIFTVGATFVDGSSPADVTYDLGAYRGSTFSPDGGLSILGSIVGDGVPATADLDLLALPTNTQVIIRDSLTNNATGSIVAPVAGELIFGNSLGGDLLLGGIAKTGTVDFGNLIGKLSIVKDVAGNLRGEGGNSTDPILIGQDITATARIFTDGGINLKVTRDVLGVITAGGNITLDVGRNISKALVTSGDNMTLKVGSNVTGSEIFAQDNINSSTNPATIGGSVVSSRITGGSGLTLSVGGSVTKSQLSGGTDTLRVTVTGNVVASRIISNSRVQVTVGGNVTTSSIIAQTSSMTVVVGGSVTGSSIVAGSDVEMTVGGDFKSSSVLAGSTIELAVGGNVLKSSLISTGSDVSLTVGKTVSSVLIDSGEDVSLTVLTGAVSGATIKSESDISINVGGKVSAKLLAGDEARITATGAFSGSLRAAGDASIQTGGFSGKLPVDIGGNLALNVTGNVGATTIFNVGGSVTDFKVVGKFDGQLSAVGNFSSLSTVVVSGAVGTKGLISVGGNLTGALVEFGAGFLGRLLVGGELQTDLTIRGAANTLAFGGSIGPIGSGNLIADIIVEGKLRSLRSSSSFLRLTPNTGNFQDGNGTTTGTLSAIGGAPQVFPEDIVTI